MSETNGVHPKLFGDAKRIVALGYCDGPTEGVIEFEDARCFHFTMPDEELQLASGGTDRTFEFAPLPVGVMDRLTTVLARHSEPHWPTWVPQWKFNSEADQRQAEQSVDALLADAGTTRLRVRTENYRKFELCNLTLASR